MKSIGSQSFDQKIKTFLFRQWEKIVFSLGVLGIFGFFWFGSVKPYEKTTPAKLRQNVQEAKTHIQNPGSWDAIASFRKANDRALEAIKNETKIDPNPYLIDRLLGTKLATRGLRTDPEIKKIIEPRVQVVVGSLLIKRPRDPVTKTYVKDYWNELITYTKKTVQTKEAAPEDTAEEGLPNLGRGGMRRNMNRNTTGVKEEVLIIPDLMRTEFAGISPAKLGLDSETHSTMVVSAVAVTALFPHEEQLKAYEGLKSAVKYNERRDQPYYVYLQIERRKRTDGQEGEWEDITNVVTEYVPKQIYAAKTPEIVEDAFVDPYLTQAIPPLFGMNYRDFCCTNQTPAIVEKESEEGLILVAKGGRPLDFKAFEQNQKEEKPKEEVITIAVPKYKLIRFFDLNVDANSSVQYRFRAWLADPNNPKREVYARVWNKDKGGDAASPEGMSDDAPEGGAGLRGRSRGGSGGGVGDEAQANSSAYDLADRDLAPEVRKRLKEQEAQPELPEPIRFLKYCRPTEWSEPTQWVTVTPAKGKLVAGRVDTGSQQNVKGVNYFEAEPQVDLVVKKWDSALQVEVPVSRKVHRGSVMNFRSNAKVINPVSLQVYPLKRELIEEGTEENGVRFDTDAFIVDMNGGEKMPYSSAEKNYFRPSEVLVMQPDGTLVVHNELKDKLEYRHGVFAEDEELVDVVAPIKTETKDEEEGPGRGRGGR